MASNSKAASTTALLLCLAIVFFTLASASSCPPKTPAKPTPKPAPAKPSPKPAPATPKPSPSFKCPKDTLKFGVCGDVLKGLIHVVVGAPLGSPCCDLIKDLTAAEAAVCLCTAVKANVMGASLNAPVCITALFNKCGKKLPKDFHCP